LKNICSVFHPTHLCINACALSSVSILSTFWLRIITRNVRRKRFSYVISEDTPYTMSRFVDTEFDNKKLPPICGYWNENLVPLEQALKLIMPRIDQLDRSIRAAKKYCHFPSEHGLTHDESAALFLYTMEGGDNSFYRVLNQALRSEDRPALKPWFPYLKLLDTALSKLPTVKGSVWRGVHGDIGKILKKNQELTWWGVTSCSLSVDIIKDFLAAETTSTVFMIETAHGKNISGYTNYSTEDEVLLSPGIHLRVAANPFTHPGGLNLVHLIEVCDDNEEQLSSSMSEIHELPRSVEQDTSSEYRRKWMKSTFLCLRKYSTIPFCEQLFVSRILLNYCCRNGNIENSIHFDLSGGNDQETFTFR
jgi:hypothetical protein